MTLESRIDALVAEHVTPDGPGAAVGVLEDGAFVHRKAYGLADLEWGTPLAPDCVFRICSLTKQFTAVAVMMLAERGALSIDDPIERWLPAWRRGPGVAVRHLLNHTSGIWRYDWDRRLRTERLSIGVDEILRLIPKRDVEFEPGAQYRYNNSGYFLLGAIIERVSGRKFGDFLSETIFGPVGMRRTGLLSDEAVTRQRARGYVRGRSGFLNARSDGAMFSYAAGGLGSTLDDLAVWDRCIRDHRLVARETFDAMLAPTPLNDDSSYPYGFGWGLCDDYLDARIYHHAGGVSGFACHMLHLRDEDLTTIVLSNRYLFPFDQMSRALLRIIKSRPFEAPQASEATPEDVAACTGRFVGEDGRPLEINGDATWVSLGQHRLCDRSDPEVEYRFSEKVGGRFQRLDYASPLWPVTTFRRGAEA